MAERVGREAWWGVAGAREVASKVVMAAAHPVVAMVVAWREAVA